MQFRHEGPMAQDFFSRVGHDGVGTIDTDVTLNTGDVSGILIAGRPPHAPRGDTGTRVPDQLAGLFDRYWPPASIMTMPPTTITKPSPARNTARPIAMACPSPR